MNLIRCQVSLILKKILKFCSQIATVAQMAFERALFLTTICRNQYGNRSFDLFQKLLALFYCSMIDKQMVNHHLHKIDFIVSVREKNIRFHSVLWDRIILTCNSIYSWRKMLPQKYHVGRHTIVVDIRRVSALLTSKTTA